MKKKFLAALLSAALLIPVVGQAVGAATADQSAEDEKGLTPTAVQYSAPYEKDGEQVVNIRFVALLDSKDYAETLVTVYESVYDKVWTFENPTVLDALTIESKDGVAYENITASDLGGEEGQYLVAAAIIGVPADEALCFTVEASVTTADNTVIEAETVYAYVKDGAPAQQGDDIAFPIPLELNVPTEVTVSGDEPVYCVFTPDEDGVYPVTSDNDDILALYGKGVIDNELYVGGSYLIVVYADTTEGAVTGHVTVTMEEEEEFDGYLVEVGHSTIVSEEVPGGWDDVKVTVKVTQTGMLTIAAAEGETNAYVATDYAPVKGAYPDFISGTECTTTTFYVEEGDVITLSVSSFDMDPDTVDLELSLRTGEEEEEEEFDGYLVDVGHSTIVSEEVPGGWDDVKVTVKVTQTGMLTIAAAEGETNAYVSTDYAPVQGAYPDFLMGMECTTTTFYVKEGDVITLSVSSNDMEPDTIDLELSLRTGEEEEEEEFDGYLVEVGHSTIVSEEVPGGWDDVKVTVKVTQTGMLTIAAADGETNAYVSTDYAPVQGAYPDFLMGTECTTTTFYVKEGDVITLSVSSNDMEPDTVDLVLSLASAE